MHMYKALSHEIVTSYMSLLPRHLPLSGLQVGGLEANISRIDLNLASNQALQN